LPDPTSRHPVSDGRMTVLRRWQAATFFDRWMGDFARLLLKREPTVSTPIFTELVEAPTPPTTAEIEAAVRRVIDERLPNCTRHLGGAGRPSVEPPSMGGAGRSVVR